MERTIETPTLALCGTDDLRAELMTDQGQYFTGEYHFELVPGAGLFCTASNPIRSRNWSSIGWVRLANKQEGHGVWT
jgi:hypothetical protein